MPKHILIYSHGFGVKKTGRGLFTDIAATFPQSEHIMFDYNQVNDDENSLIISPLTTQRETLRQVIFTVQENYPGASVDIIAHSQGCVTVGLARPQGIRKAVLIAPPSSMSSKHMLETFGQREGSKIDVHGLTSFPRRDGSTTIVPPEYWDSIKDIDPIQLYNELSISEVTIINANQDEILKVKDFSQIAPTVEILNLDDNHDFTNNRNGLCQVISSLLAQ